MASPRSLRVTLSHTLHGNCHRTANQLGCQRGQLIGIVAYIPVPWSVITDPLPPNLRYGDGNTDCIGRDPGGPSRRFGGMPWTLSGYGASKRITPLHPALTALTSLDASRVPTAATKRMSRHRNSATAIWFRDWVSQQTTSHHGPHGSRSLRQCLSEEQGGPTCR